MLEINKFNKIIVANWKLNGSFDFIESYFEILNKLEIKKDVCGIVCPPHVYLNESYEQSNSLYIGAQDCSNYDNGAYTGEISSLMIKDLGLQFCLVGHSERRQIFRQSNEDIKLKIFNLIKNSLNPILCIGETLEEKENGLTQEILKKQIIECMSKNCSKNNLIIAYEPIWAIGSGLTPTLKEIDNIHTFIKNGINEYIDFKTIYGGSVKVSNAYEIMALKNVDGVLVGGASLDAMEFSKILTS